MKSSYQFYIKYIYITKKTMYNKHIKMAEAFGENVILELKR